MTLIHLGNCRLGCGTVVKGHKAKSARAGGHAIHGEEDILYVAEFAKAFTELGFIGGIVQVSNIQLNTLGIFTTTRRSVVGVISGGAIVRWRSGIVFTAAFGGTGARAGA